VTSKTKLEETMLEITLTWKPNPEILEKLLALSTQQQKPLEALLDEAVLQYLQTKDRKPLTVEDDPIVGMYSGSPDLSIRAEEILEQEIHHQSGWTWKQ